METMVTSARSQRDNIVFLRNQALELTKSMDDEEILTEVVALLNGTHRPCAYSYEQMEEHLMAAEESLRQGEYISQSELRKQYGL